MNTPYNIITLYIILIYKNIILRSGNKICYDSGTSAPLQSKVRMGRTPSTTHPDFFYVSATAAPL